MPQKSEKKRITTMKEMRKIKDKPASKKNKKSEKSTVTAVRG